MNRQDIIAMAREAVMEEINDFLFYATDDNLEQFAALVIAKDRERLAAGVELPESLALNPKNARYTLDQLRDYGDRRAAAERNEATRKCDSRSQSLHNDGNHVAANEAHKCGSAIGGARGAQL